MTNHTQNHKPVLRLVLKKKWFEMILLGTKREEYREVKPYWNRVFSNYIRIKGKNYHPTDVNIEFSHGYSKLRRKVVMTCENLTIGEGIESWGAVPGKYYFKLHLGHIVWSNC